MKPEELDNLEALAIRARDNIGILSPHEILAVNLDRKNVLAMIARIRDLESALAGRQAVIGEQALRIAQLDQKCILLGASLKAADAAKQAGPTTAEILEICEAYEEGVGSRAAIATQQQATQSATIDSGEFRILLDEWHFAQSGGDQKLALIQIIEHIDARLAAAGMTDNRDAERYRWLRNSSIGQWQHPVVVSQERVTYPRDHMRYLGPLCDAALDKAIDAAMAAAEGEAKK